MDSKQLRKLWTSFYVNKGHSIIGSASVIPENDPTVLFTTAGMHPLVPYLLGQAHPAGKRLCNIQKCIRTGDIDEVGDASHCTFFEMLGNWSLGDYFKDEQIAWSFEFLTKHLGLNVSQLAVSVFAGDSDCPRDEHSARLWQEQGLSTDRIYFLPKENNWWGPAGTTGPCGPDSEMFIIKGEPCGKDCSPACDCGAFLEIWNDVFMQYFKNAEGGFEPLSQKNVDTGMGLERTLCVLNNKTSVYETDLFTPIIAKIEQLSGFRYEQKTRAIRIVADHIRTSVHIMGDRNGVTCSNVGQGYILRRLLRRAIRFGRELNLTGIHLIELARVVIDIYKDEYPELALNQAKVEDELRLECERFEKTLSHGIKELEKLANSLKNECHAHTITGEQAFRLYDTYGFPIEMTEELAKEYGFSVDKSGFDEAFKQHQQRSQGAGGSFKGGLSDNSEAVTRLHTATHLLHKALKVVLKDPDVNQKGSNITEERLRFDFCFGRPMTAEEIQQTEDLVNSVIASGCDVVCSQMTVEQARNAGAIGLFGDKYGQEVKVYSIGDFSMEMCGGPHVSSLKELGRFKIVKEQSSSSGVRRIKAVVLHE